MMEIMLQFHFLTMFSVHPFEHRFPAVKGYEKEDPHSHGGLKK